MSGRWSANEHNPILQAIACIRLWNNIKPVLNKLLFLAPVSVVSPVVQWHLFL